MAFAVEERKRIVSENSSMKSDVTAVAKEIGKRWRALSDAEKAKYKSKGASMKTRKSSRKAAKAAVKAEKKKTRKGPRKMSGYMKFASKTRKEIVAENPSMRTDVTAVAKELGKRWRSMSDAEKRKFD